MIDHLQRRVWALPMLRRGAPTLRGDRPAMASSSLLRRACLFFAWQGAPREVTPSAATLSRRLSPTFTRRGSYSVSHALNGRRFAARFTKAAGVSPELARFPR